MNRVKIDTVWLMSIQKPARYIGGEWNSIVKEHDCTDVKVALAFPDVYEVAMSHLGLKIIYSVINKRKDALAERVYAPWVDMEEMMRQKKIPTAIRLPNESFADLEIIKVRYRSKK